MTPTSVVFSSKTTVPIHMDNSYVGGRTVCSSGPGHITKRAATPLYGEPVENLLQNLKYLVSYAFKWGLISRFFENC